MKKVVLVFVVLFSILILLSVSTIFAENPTEFKNNCKPSGCFIYKKSGVNWVRTGFDWLVILDRIVLPWLSDS